MSAKVLLVDDEPSVLSGYERTLHRDFEVSTANGGVSALQAMHESGPYAVIVSDMRMPGMSGSQFLAKARQLSPDSARMLLTGYTDIGAAVEAVNEGNIFRFLTKPCSKEILVAAINAGITQYNLVRSEKELLEQTLIGSIRVLADFLGATNPEAFGRSMRIVHYVRHIARGFRLEHAWRLDAAAILSQLGCVTLSTDVIQRAFVGMKLSLDDQARFDSHPEAAMRLLSGVPRLEPVAWMIGQQLNRNIPLTIDDLAASDVEETLLGARILKLAVAFDDLRLKPLSGEEAIGRLLVRSTEFDRGLVNTLIDLKPQCGRMELRKVLITKLATGMILDQEIRNKKDILLFAKGQEITSAILIKLENFALAALIDREVMALVQI